MISDTTLKKFTGNWKTKLNTLGLEIIFHIKDENGVFTTSIDIPQQSVSGIKAGKTKVINSRIIIADNTLGFELEAELSGNTLKGELIQLGIKFPVILERVEKEFCRYGRG